MILHTFCKILSATNISKLLKLTNIFSLSSFIKKNLIYYMTEFELKFKEKTGKEFNDYYKQYKPKLTWYLTKYTRSIEKADEFANMAFVQGLEKIDTYNSELSQFITWLTSIAVNLVIKDYKDRQKIKTMSIEHELSDNFTISNLLKYDDNSDMNEKDMENKAKCDIVKKVIYSLPDKYKKVMIMRELDNKPYKHIAESIKKEYEVNVTNDTYKINTTEYFHSATITNNGMSDVKIKINNNGYTIVLLPNEKKTINKDDINKDEINVLSDKSSSNIKITETTNLSTIKSQIKKGRFLIRKKVKKDFDLIDKHGVQ